MAMTTNQRLKKMRDVRRAANWVEVRVWVPTRQDAEDVQALAAQRRALAPNPADYAATEYASWASK